MTDSGAGLDVDHVPSAAAVAVRTEADLRTLIAAGRSNPAYDEVFLKLLDEHHPVYQGHGAAAVVRMRGWVLHALADGDLPMALLPFVCEELESPHDPYLAARAARILRRVLSRSAAQPEHVEALLTALFTFRFHDDAVWLDAYGGHGTRAVEDPNVAVGQTPTTATAEILRTLGTLGSIARPALERLHALRAEPTLAPALVNGLDQTLAAIEADSSPNGTAAPETPPCCCGGSDVAPTEAREADSASRPPFTEVQGLVLEDQAGRRLRMGDFFVGQPTIVVFFYTRCDNPTKCARTISRLGEVQRLLHARGLGSAIRTAAITYDPAYDHPARLKRYADTWGAALDDDHRMLRAVDDFAPLRNYFALGVGYGAAVVNRHRVEAFVLDAGGRIEHAISRRSWTADELVDAAIAIGDADLD